MNLTWRRIGKSVAILIGCGALAGLAVAGVRLHDFVNDRAAPEPPTGPSPLESVRNLRPVTVTITTPTWSKVRLTVTMDRLHSDFVLWRQMHFEDWDGVPRMIREPALLAMIRAHAAVFAGPAAWRAMTVDDWDGVPQPVRAMAYLRMIWHWAAVEDVGREFGCEPRLLAQTIGAIVMAESWFEHRAFNENPWGNRDLGLAQCSDYCRKEIARMSESGEIAFAPSEADYFDPRIATRVATVWFERELMNAAGDVDLAIRAYHRGIDAAMDEKGDAYLVRVRSLRERYIRQHTASATWRLLAREIARIHPPAVPAIRR
jgi:hypothetical protein